MYDLLESTLLIAPGFSISVCLLFGRQIKCNCYYSLSRISQYDLNKLKVGENQGCSEVHCTESCNFYFLDSLRSGEGREEYREVINNFVTLINFFFTTLYGNIFFSSFRSFISVELLWARQWNMKIMSAQIYNWQIILYWIFIVLRVFLNSGVVHTS